MIAEKSDMRLALAVYNEEQRIELSSLQRAYLAPLLSADNVRWALIRQALLTEERASEANTGRMFSIQASVLLGPAAADWVRAMVMVNGIRMFELLRSDYCLSEEGLHRR